MTPKERQGQSDERELMGTDDRSFASEFRRRQRDNRRRWDVWARTSFKSPDWADIRQRCRDEDQWLAENWPRYMALIAETIRVKDDR